MSSTRFLNRVNFVRHLDAVPGSFTLQHPAIAAEREEQSPHRRCRAANCWLWTKAGEKESDFNHFPNEGSSESVLCTTCQRHHQFYLIKGKTRGGCQSLSQLVLAESPSLPCFPRRGFNCLQLRLFNCYIFSLCFIKFLNLLRLSRFWMTYFQRDQKYPEKVVTPNKGSEIPSWSFDSVLFSLS